MAAQIVDIPSPSQLPWVGHLLQMPKSRLVQHVLEVSRQFDGIFQLNFAGLRVPFVYSADLVAEVCDETRFRKIIRPPLLTLRELAKDGLFTAHSDEPNWGKAHRVLMSAFSQRAMKGYFDPMLHVAQQLVRKWEARADVLVADDMTRLTLDTISLTGFDYRFNSFETEKLHPFLEAMGRVLTNAMNRLTRLPIQNRWMPQSQYRADIAAMNQLVDEVIRTRREQPTDANDLLNLMLNAVDPETNERLDDLNIRYQVITFLIAGHETTSGLLTFALYLLLRHPYVLAQAYAEVDRVLPGDTVPVYAHLSQLEVIERVLKETLRLWPTAPGFSVAPYETTVIGGRYRIYKDQTVTVPLPALHRDKNVWADPEAFDIDRFLPAAEAKLHRHAYKPFGNGERACIGRQFALTEAKLGLAVILQHFALSEPHDYRLRIKETLTLKPDAFYLRAKRRRPHERIATPLNVAAKPTPQAEAGVRGEGKPFTVLYGTSLGTSREVAEQVSERARNAGFAAAAAPLDDYAERLPHDGVLIVVTATYNGKAPDTARKTAALIEQGAFGALQRPNLKYAVLGCGNSQWPTFQGFPKLIDDVLAQTGATRVLARAEADGNGDFDGAVERWMGQLWKALGGAEAAPDKPRVTVAYASDSDARAGVLPELAYTLSVVCNEELVRDPAGLWDFGVEAPRASTRHITLRLPEGIEYRTGDHLAIYPRNRPEAARAVAERLGINPNAVVILAGDATRLKHLPIGKPVTVAQLLADFVELQDPVTRNHVRRLLAHTSCPHTRATLEALVAEDDTAVAHFQNEIANKRVTLHELLLRFPAIRLPFDAFLDTCAPIRQRLYSISSSALVSPREVSLTVGTVVGRAWSGEGGYRGVTSAYLQNLAPGAEVIGLVRRPDPPFAPADNLNQPMILVGPGTGFAPFRGFLEERAAQQARGLKIAPSHVFYGCRHPEHDWFYAEEMRRWEASGVAKVHLAFSVVPSHPHRFVQDALWAERDELWSLLEGGSTIYVCGDGRLMAPAVRDTLIRICMERRRHTHADASNWLQTLIKTGHYRQDVFGSVGDT